MSWEVSVASILGGGAAVISGTVACYAWRQRTRWMALPFTALAITLSLWQLSYGIQLGFGTLAEQLRWQRLTLGVAGFVPTMWLLFTLAYTGREEWVTRDRILLFLTEPVAFLALCLTNPTHGLVWTSAVLTETAIGDVPALTFGAGYAIHIAYAYAAVATGIGLLVIHGTRVASMYQKQVLLLILAAAPPFLSHIAFTLGAGPVPHLDLTPFLFAFTGVLLGLALFRFELLRLSPVARSQSLREVGDGLVVVSNSGEIVDLFGVATDVLEPTPAVGDQIETVFLESSLEALDGSEMTTSTDNGRRVYQFRVSELTDHRDRQVGTMLIVRDITGLQESKQRLSVSDRVLRHNLRNDMNVVLGFATQLEDRLSGQDARDVRAIRETSENLLELTEKAKQITELHAVANGGETTIDATQHIREVIDDLRTQYPAVDFRVDAADEVPVDGVDSKSFRLAIENVLDNAVRHNDATEPVVKIAVERIETATQIEIADNGPGIPEIERRAIGPGMESPMEHSQGLGLWLTYWCVTMWDGELRLDSTGSGTAVVITVPTNRSSSMENDSHGDATL